MCLKHPSQLAQLALSCSTAFSILLQSRGTYPSFHIPSDLFCGLPGQQSRQFCKFSFFLLIIMRSILLLLLLEGNNLKSNWYSPISERTDKCFSCHWHSTEWFHIMGFSSLSESFSLNPFLFRKIVLGSSGENVHWWVFHISVSKWSVPLFLQSREHLSIMTPKPVFLVPQWIMLRFIICS